MTDHDPRAADAELFGQKAVGVASRIAAYVATNTDAGNWGPQRWAYEAVMVILNDDGAAHDVLRCLEGQTAYDLAVIPVGSVPPWMEFSGAYDDPDQTRVRYEDEDCDHDFAECPVCRPLYAIREAD